MWQAEFRPALCLPAAKYLFIMERPMFTNLWKRSVTAELPESYEYTIARSGREPLSFNGSLVVESDGERLLGYRPGEPYHCLRVYQEKPTGYVVIIEFHLNDATILVEAERGENVDELDDFLSAHEAECFRTTFMASEEEFVNARAWEERVLNRYDLQVIDVLRRINQEHSV